MEDDCSMTKFNANTQSAVKIGERIQIRFRFILTVTKPYTTPVEGGHLMQEIKHPSKFNLVTTFHQCFAHAVCFVQ